MQPNIRVMLFDEDGERFFGEGPCRLLHAIEQTGSLRAAAQSMQMAYTKALGLVRHAEQVLGFALTERKIGGKGGNVFFDRCRAFWVSLSRQQLRLVSDFPADLLADAVISTAHNDLIGVFACFFN